jgi:DNA-binding response OmpR family regulator
MSNTRVLIVEDEPMIGELLCGVFDMHGYQARLACTGKDGLHQASDWCPDIVLLDVMLPDIDGFEVCRSIRAQGAGPGIVMLTGMMTHEGRVRGFGSGTDRFLTKPFNVTSLMSEVESVLEEYKTTDREVGLRTTTVLAASPSVDFERSLADFLVQLAQKTPLSPRDIDAMGIGLTEIARLIRQWEQTHSAKSSWQLVCRVYRDRIETRLECADTAPPEQRDRLHELFHLASNKDPIVAQGLANRIDFPDHGSVAVLVREYPKSTS